MSLEKKETSSSSPLVSVVIPCRGFNAYLEESISGVLNQKHQNLEILVLSDSPISQSFPRTKVIVAENQGPAEKRDLALEHSQGEFLAFIDDDAFPAFDWLDNALASFSDAQVGAVCGPGVTPPSDSIFQKASGWVFASWLGGGPFSFRFLPQERREVDDFPAMNFIVRRKSFEAVGGFNSSFWPGEDTKLCLDLTRKLEQKIIYDPRVLVFHHRRPLFYQHLEQAGRYGQQRGHFARVLPGNSRKLSYFIPSAFTLFLFMGLSLPAYSLVLSLYFFLLCLTVAWVYSQEKNLKISLLVMPGIFLTHVWYGFRFIQGFLFRGLGR